MEAMPTTGLRPTNEKKKMKLTKRSEEVLALIAEGADKLPWVPKTLGTLRQKGLIQKDEGGWFATEEGRRHLSATADSEATGQPS